VRSHAHSELLLTLRINLISLDPDTLLSREVVISGVKAHLEMIFHLRRWRSRRREMDFFGGALLTKQNSLDLAVAELLFLHLHVKKASLLGTIQLNIGEINSS